MCANPRLSRSGSLSETEMNRSLISVIIPTYNSEEFLENCLKSIISQSYTNIEIIIVDNYSLDKTLEIAAKYGRVVLHEGPRSEGRNIGAALAQGEYILSLDSDMEVSCHVLRQCLSQAKKGFDAIIIPEISIGEGYWAECRALEKLCYIDDDLIEAARFFRKDAFEAVDGYDPTLVFGEDWDLSQRIRKTGFRVGRVNSIIKHNEGRLSLRQSMIKKSYYWKSFKDYSAKNPEEAKQQMMLIRPAFVRNWRKLANDPLHSLGMIILKVFEFLYGWVGSRRRN